MAENPQGKAVRGILLDVDYTTEKDSEIAIRLFVRTAHGIDAFFDRSFKPYFYAIAAEGLLEKVKKEIENAEFENGARVLRVERVEKANAENVLKLTFKNTEDLGVARDAVKAIRGVRERREYDIPFATRYIIDKRLEPMGEVEVEVGRAAGSSGAENHGGKNALERGENTGGRREAQENEIRSIKMIESAGDVSKSLRIGCFDLETYSKGTFSDAREDPIIMISYAEAGRETEVFTTKKIPEREWVRAFADEKGMIEELLKRVRERDLDIIVTYNGDGFDFPYIEERAKKLGVKPAFGALGDAPKAQRKGLDTAVRVRGRVHLDAYKMLLLLARLGVVGLIKFDLESVCEVLFGYKKNKIHAENINKIWETGKGLAELVEYNREDAEYTLKIALRYLPLIIEMSRLVRHTAFDASRFSASMLVESLLMNKAFEQNMLVPNRPSEEETKQRILQTFKGGYVKEPIPGLHENIAVLDFRSLYPSIITSHNISPETLNCGHAECKTGANLAPTKDWFCGKQQGFLSAEMKEVLERRIEIKKEMKSAKKGSEQHSALDARQHALKILLNSQYGYLAYARSRWYSRECAKAVTAWGRHYVTDVLEKAEKSGFTALYGDSDSAFLTTPKEKEKKSVEEFVQAVNSTLPGKMELELEGFYRRGIFVTRRAQGEVKAAKKRYALVDYDGNLKIVGFEYVRRDWARVAKDTQRAVIEAVLKEGKPEKAVEIVRKTVEELKSGKVPKHRLVVMTQIQKPLKEYAAIGPHIAAAQKAIRRGKQLGEGSVIGYIITRNGKKSISERAELEEFVQEGNYDAEYYIENQVLPAVGKILAELGYSREDLAHGGKQHTLGHFS